jgi:hypothetical protein
VGIHRQPDQLEAEQIGERLDAGIAQRFRQHHVARPGERAEHHGHGVLPAGGDDDLLRRDIQPIALHPGRAGRAMVGPAAILLIVEQPADAGVPRHLRQPLRQHRVLIAAGGEVHAEIDHAVAALRLRQRHQALAAHIGAAPDLALDQSAPLRLGIGARHRADGDAEPVGEIAVGRQPIAVAQLAVLDIGGERIDDGQVARTGCGGEVGRPNCHGDNVYIDGDNQSTLSL